MGWGGVDVFTPVSGCMVRERKFEIGNCLVHCIVHLFGLSLCKSAYVLVDMRVCV